MGPVNDLQQLCEMIAARAPEAAIALDEPLASGSTWWADISRNGHRAVVEWRPGRGFGISGEGGGYGEGPDEVVLTADEALDRVLKRIEATVAAH